MGVLNSADIAAAGGATSAQVTSGSGVSAEALVGGAKAQVEQVKGGIATPAVRPLYGFIHYGDSIAQGGSDYRTNTFGAQDLTAQTAMASDGVLFPIKPGGIGGQPTPILAARVVRDMQKYKPNVVGFSGGTNNFIIYGDTNNDPNPFTTLYDDIATIHNAAKVIGAFFYVCTMPPRALDARDLTWVPQGNAIIRQYATDHDIPLVDFYDLLNDPANPGNYKANWTIEGTHPITPVSWLMAQIAWQTISPYLLPDRRQTVPQQDAANLLFTAVNSYGEPSNTSTRDALFRNSRVFAQNGYSVTCPYWVGTIFTGSGTAPTVVGALAPAAGVRGNLWTVTATPNGAGTVNLQSAQGGRAIDVTRYQGRRVRISFKASASGFDIDNTYAYLAANANLPRSAWALTFACKDSSGATIASSNILDPLDAGSSLGQASTIPLLYQVIPFQYGSLSSMCYDFTLRQFYFDICIPAGAIEINPSFGVRFLAGATSPVTVGLAEFGFEDMGPAYEARPALPESNREVSWRDISAATTISAAEAVAIQVWRCTGTFALTLPAASSSRGRVLTVKCISGTVTVTAAGSDTIDGAATLALTAGQSARLLSTGARFEAI